MNRTIATLLLLIGYATTALAQQGHPLTGTWQGEWGPDANTQHFVTLIMDWDGKRITGMANPGPDSTPIDQITLNANDWSVMIDMDMKDSQSQQLRFKGQGTLRELGSQTRTIEGTWTGSGQQGTFTLTRQSGP